MTTSPAKPRSVPFATQPEVTALLANDPQVWVLMRAVLDVKERGEKVVLQDIASMVDRRCFEEAYFWATAVDQARHIARMASPERMVPALDATLEVMIGALAAYRKGMK